MAQLYALTLGLFFAAAGLFAILDPKLGLLRDVDAIQSDESGEVETVFSYLGGFMLLLISLFFIFLSVAPYL